MATLVTRYVRLTADPGGDGTVDADSGGGSAYAYDSLAAAITGEEGDISTGTGSDTELHIEITTGGVESPASTLTLSNFTTDATGFLTIEGTGAAHHAGVSRENSGTGYQCTRAGDAQAGATDYYRVKGLEFTTSGATFNAWDDGAGGGVSTTDKRFEEMLFTATSGTHAAYTLYLRGAATLSLINVLSMSPNYRAADIRDSTATVDHCGFVSGGPYGCMVSANVLVSNSYAISTGANEDWFQTADGSSSHNASLDNSTDPSTNAVDIVATSNEFTNYTAVPSTADLNLKDSLLNKKGTGSRANDITGSARSGTADIGPFNWTAGAATTQGLSQQGTYGMNIMTGGFK